MYIYEVVRIVYSNKIKIQTYIIKMIRLDEVLNTLSGLVYSINILFNF